MSIYIPLVSGDLLGTLAVRQDMQAWIKKNGVKNTDSAYSTYQQQYLSFCTSRGLPKEAPEVIGRTVPAGRHGGTQADGEHTEWSGGKRN